MSGEGTQWRLCVSLEFRTIPEDFGGYVVWSDTDEGVIRHPRNSVPVPS